MWINEHASSEWLRGWEEHFRKWPPVAVVSQIGFGHVASLICNTNRSKNGKVYQPSDFFPTLRAGPVQSEEEQMDNFAGGYREDAWKRFRDNRSAAGQQDEDIL